MGAVRLRARVDRCDRRPDLREQLDQGRRLHPRSLGVGRRALRGRGAAREGRRGPRRDPAPPARPDLRRPRRPGCSRPRLRDRASRTRCAKRGDAIEEGDLFTYIYTSGTTGPPKGCMISHLNYYAMVAVVDDLPSFTGPEDTMLLYLPLAHNFGRLMHLSGRLRRLRDRVPARPAAGGGGVADGEADRLPERAARLREDPHRGRRQVRRDDRSKPQAGRLGARRRPARQRAAPRRQARPARPRGAAHGSPTSSSTRR